MKTILHISRMNFLSNKAHVYTTTKTCEALSVQEGVRVILLSSDNSLKDKVELEEFFRKHDIKSRFDIVSLDSFANHFRNSSLRLFNWLETFFVNITIAKFVLKNRYCFDVLYYRDCSLFIPIIVIKYFLKKPIFLELHAVLHKKHGQWFNNFFSRISNGLIAITYGLKDYYKKYNSNIIVSFCAAAEPEKFDLIKDSKEVLRTSLNMPLDKTVLMYSGNLYKTGNYDSYGIEDIIKSVAFLDRNIIFMGIGKKGNETQEHERLAQELKIRDRIIFLPWVNREKLYKYWKASDILVHPAAGAQIGNSPTKIFEYLASGKPIISADTLPIREVLHNRKNALLVENYQNSENWVSAVNEILSDQKLCEQIVNGALMDSKQYTWNNRGLSIVKFINQNTFYSK